MKDYKEISSKIIRNTEGIKGKPIGISLFTENIPDTYDPLKFAPCCIIKKAMIDEEKVYFSADNNDCLVGVHHAGMVPGTIDIAGGGYLSKAVDIYSEVGAARLKSGEYVLPNGMFKGIGAAPLDDIPDDVKVLELIDCNFGFISVSDA